jgi:hypothetical protein
MIPMRSDNKTAGMKTSPYSVESQYGLSRPDSPGPEGTLIGNCELNIQRPV